MSEDFYNQIYSQDNPASEAHGWVQWKNTNVCMDMHCKCGYHGHFDGEFFYYYECPACKAKYAVGQNVKLIALTSDQVEYAAASGIGFQTDLDYDPDDTN